MTSRSAARRHQDELGGALAVHRERPGPVPIAIAVVLVLIATALTLLNPDPTIGLIGTLLPGIVFAVLAVLILMLVGGETLIVCERGLILGSTALWLQPSVVRYEQIVPGSVVPVLTSALRLARETSAGGPNSAFRTAWWTRRGVAFVGPSAASARRRRAPLASLLDHGPNTVDDRHLWFIATGRTAPEAVTAQIARAADAAGFGPLARATAGAPVRRLTGRPADAARQLPGMPPV